MKKLISIMMLFVMTAALAACVKPVDPVVKPTNEPTAVPAETQTAVPTEEPTAAPTEAPTPEPTAVPEPVPLDFGLCGEEIASIPMGQGELDARLEEEGGVWVPEHYCVSDGRIYILNGFAEGGKKTCVLVYDMESGRTSRLLFDSQSPLFTGFTVTDGKLVTPDFIFDTETFEATPLQRLIPEGGSDEVQRLIAMRAVGGKVIAYVGDSQEPFMSRTVDEYELDPANLMWTLKRRVTEPSGENGFRAGEAEFSIGPFNYYSNRLDGEITPSGRYLGANEAGEHFVSFEFYDEELGREFAAVTRFNENGVPVSTVRIDVTGLYSEGPWVFETDSDGCVYFMRADGEYLKVYRVDMEIKVYALDFEARAELAVRLRWGKGDKEVFVQKPTAGVEDDDWVIPQHFNVIGGKVYILDRYYYHGNGIIEYDTESGRAERLSPDIGDYDFFNGEFAILDGKVIFARYMFDLETGERIVLQDIPALTGSTYKLHFMNVRDGKCYAYVDDDPSEYPAIWITDALDEYELDMENRMWILKRKITIPQDVPHAVKVNELWVVSHDRYMGTDAAGNHYVDTYSYYQNPDGEYTSWHRISKISADGRPVSYVDVFFPDNYINMWIDENWLIFKVDGDGNVWYMCETEAEFLVYKIKM